MADEATVAAPVEAPAAAAAAAAPVEPIQTNGDTSTIPQGDEEAAGKQATTEVTAPDGDGTTEVDAAPSAALDQAEADATPASGKKEKRKSVGGGLPEHKNKKLNKKKSMPVLRLECKPGEFYWARLKGYPPWPSVICDEQMLPESLLATRPVSTARPDGSIRDDFKEGGKNAKERTFPIMFLSTNEFTWMVNTSLTPLDPEECKTLPNAKMTKALGNAWKIASESHDLDYFKGILKIWQEEQAELEQEMREREEREAREAEERAARKAEEEAQAAEEEAKGKKKPKSRKSKGGEDVEMEDADAPKSAKKRKKDAESDGDGAKPKKTPKVTKLNAPKTPNGDSSVKKSASKSKKKVVQAPKEEEEDEKPQMTEAEKLATREKAVLYLRHRLQKGFLSRDQAPQEAEMAAMADFFGQLEAYENLEPAIIRATKVHKVLKAIVKLSSIPKDEEFGFKKRSAAMLEIWNKRMEADGDVAPPSATEAKAPGSLPVAEKKEEDKAPATNGETAAEQAPAETESAKEDSETKEGAEEEVKEKAEEAADKLDEKVEVAAEGEEKKDGPEVPAKPVVKDSADVLKDITTGEAVPGEEKDEAAKEATEAPAAAEAS